MNIRLLARMGVWRPHRMNGKQEKSATTYEGASVLLQASFEPNRGTIMQTSFVTDLIKWKETGLEDTYLTE